MPAECCKETYNKIPDDEPIFIIRGKDMLALPVIKRWLVDAKKAGVNVDKLKGAMAHYQAVKDFQEDHPDRVKIPD